MLSHHMRAALTEFDLGEFKDLPSDTDLYPVPLTSALENPSQVLSADERAVRPRRREQEVPYEGAELPVLLLVQSQHS
jgi:hypothetical protein